MIHQIINKTYWYILAPIIIAKVRFPLNLIIGASISMLITIVFVFIYDKTKKDWLLLESLKETQANLSSQKRQNTITKKIAYWAKKDKKMLSIFLVCWDATVATLYLREGHHLWNKIPLKTLHVFILGSFIPNLIWAILISGLLFIIT